MKRFFVFFILFFSVYNTELISQCSYNLLNLNHVDCYGDNTGEIEIKCYLIITLFGGGLYLMELILQILYLQI